MVGLPISFMVSMAVFRRFFPHKFEFEEGAFDFSNHDVHLDSLSIEYEHENEQVRK